jgi:serine protease Do
VGSVKPGTKSTLTVFRRGGSKDLSVVIGEIEPDRVAKKTPEREEKPKATVSAQVLGLTVSELTDAQKKELKIKGGVKVETSVDAAARAGVREGDVIVAIANAEVVNVKEFEAAVAKIDKSKAVNLLFHRGEWAQYAVIRAAR